MNKIKDDFTQYLWKVWQDLCIKDNNMSNLKIDAYTFIKVSWMNINL